MAGIVCIGSVDADHALFCNRSIISRDGQVTRSALLFVLRRRIDFELPNTRGRRSTRKLESGLHGDGLGQRHPVIPR